MCGKGENYYVFQEGNMIKRLTIIAVLFLCTLQYLEAYSLLDLNIGSEVAHHDARSAALGGVGVAGGFSLMDGNINPANLYFLNKNMNFQFTYSMIKNSENRALPLYNFFDSYSGESTYARNENFYHEMALGIHYALPVNEAKLAIAFTMRPVINFGANYTEEVRNDDSSDLGEGKFGMSYPPIIAKNYIESNGLLDSYNIQFAFGVPLPLNFGMHMSFDDFCFVIGTEVSYYTGKNEFEKRIKWTEIAREKAGTTALKDSLSIGSNEISGVGFNIGLSSQITSRIRFGAVFQPKIILDSDIAYASMSSADLTKFEEMKYSNNKGDYVIPSKNKFGLLYIPRNPFKTNFQVDMQIIKYSQVNKFYDDSYGFSVGMEHYVGRSVPFRLGFSHKTARQDRGIVLPSISVGTGFTVVNNLVLDIATEYGRREYEEMDLFPDGLYANTNLWSNGLRPQDRVNPDKVTESFLKIFTSLSYRF